MERINFNGEVITLVAYDKATQDLYLKFATTRIGEILGFVVDKEYKYINVPPQVWKAIKSDYEKGYDIDLTIGDLIIGCYKRYKTKIPEENA